MYNSTCKSKGPKKRCCCIVDALFLHVAVEWSLAILVGVLVVALDCSVPNVSSAMKM